MAIDFDDLLYGRGFEEGAGYALFYAEDDAFACCNLGLLSMWKYRGERRANRTPIAVEPSLMASREYSTWKRRPSGEKVLWRYKLEVMDFWNRDGLT